VTLDLEELLRQVRAYDMLVISPTEVWPSPWVTGEIQTALVEHQDNVARHLEWGDARLCVDPGLHRDKHHGWIYLGRGRWTCKLCVQLDRSISA